MKKIGSSILILLSVIGSFVIWIKLFSLHYDSRCTDLFYKITKMIKGVPDSHLVIIIGIILIVVIVASLIIFVIKWKDIDFICEKHGNEMVCLTGLIPYVAAFVLSIGWSYAYSSMPEVFGWTKAAETWIESTICLCFYGVVMIVTAIINIVIYKGFGIIVSYYRMIIGAILGLLILLIPIILGFKLLGFLFGGETENTKSSSKSSDKEDFIRLPDGTVVKRTYMDAFGNEYMDVNTGEKYKLVEYEGNQYLESLNVDEDDENNEGGRIYL